MKLRDWILIKRIEWALGFKLYDWQKKYIRTGKFEPPPGRATGKTTIHCVKLALTKETYQLHEIGKMKDGDYGPAYHVWFQTQFMYIRKKLKRRWFKVCEIRHKGRRL